MAEHMNDMAPRLDDYEFWSTHEAISDLRDQGVYEEEDVDQAFPRGRKGRKGKGKGRGKGKGKSRSPSRRRSRSRSQGPSQEEESEEEEAAEESEPSERGGRVFRTPSRPGRWRLKRQARSRCRGLGRRRESDAGSREGPAQNGPHTHHPRARR